MGDITALLGCCPNVDDPNAMYDSAQVSTESSAECTRIDFAQREVHTLMAVVDLDPNQLFKDVSKSDKMFELCKMVRCTILDCTPMSFV